MASCRAVVACNDCVDCAKASRICSVHALLVTFLRRLATHLYSMLKLNVSVDGTEKCEKCCAVYERTCPIFNGTCQPNLADGSLGGPTHVVIGNAGFSLS